MEECIHGGWESYRDFPLVKRGLSVPRENTLTRGLHLKGQCRRCEPAEDRVTEDLVQWLGLEMDRNY